MARFSHNTAAAAGAWLGVGRVFPHGSVPINMESALRWKPKRKRLELLSPAAVLQYTSSPDYIEVGVSCLQYLGHMRWQLGAYEANVVVVDGGVDAWDHQRSWR